MQKDILLITGASGYVGAMLIDFFSKKENVEKIICIDKEIETDLTKNLKEEYRKKIVFLETEISENTWQNIALDLKPNIVIHTAWQIREIYGNRQKSWKLNIIASEKIFDFVFENDFVKKFIYFSTVSSYGAMASNSINYRYTEKDIFRKTDYLYAEEKRITEEILEKKYNEFFKDKNTEKIVSVLRPAAITGPRGRIDRVRFGLQSALSGTLKGGIYSIVSLLTSFVPITKNWLRQYIHEDDVANIVEMLSFNKKENRKYEVFNICSPGECVLGKDMAKAVNKKAILIHPYLIRIVFFFFWHITRGKIPTGKGAWKGYSYPIAVSGEKLTEKYNYVYLYEPLKAFVENIGRYKK